MISHSSTSCRAGRRDRPGVGAPRRRLLVVAADRETPSQLRAVRAQLMSLIRLELPGPIKSPITCFTGPMTEALFALAGVAPTAGGRDVGFGSCLFRRLEIGLRAASSGA